MKMNNKGFVVEGVLVISLLVGGVLLFVPNPVSSALGVGVRPNKTVEKEKTYDRVELLKDEKGNPVLAADGAYLARRSGGTFTSDVEKQQRVSIWEQLRALPILYLILMGLGGLSPVIAGGMGIFNKRIAKLWKQATKEKETLLTDTRKIIIGLERAFSTVPMVLAGTNLPGEVDRAKLAEKIVDEMKWELGDYYNDSTKALVKSIKNGEAPLKK